MKIQNTAFKNKTNRDMAYKELKEHKIRCDTYNIKDGYYYVAWCPYNKEQYQKAVKIVESHLD
jgi:hypothetical protein